MMHDIDDDQSLHRGFAMRAAVSRAYFDHELAKTTTKLRLRAASWTAALLLTAVGTVMAVHAGAALAQDTGPCAQIVAAAERLACYDRALPPATATPAAAPVADTPTGAATPAATQPETPETIAIVVVDVRALPGRSARFTTDKGEVWIQNGAERVYVPDVPFNAELKPASMGSYFLRPSEHGWSVHVRRSN